MRTKCEHNDCGWCMMSKDNDLIGKCNTPQYSNQCQGFARCEAFNTLYGDQRLSMSKADLADLNNRFGVDERIQESVAQADRCASDTATKRKQRPVYSGVLKYFPDALMEVAHCSFIANEQHNPGEPMHWNRAKSADEHDSLVRHLLDAGTIDTDGIRHSTKVAWRALALLQKELEQTGDNA